MRISGDPRQTSCSGVHSGLIYIYKYILDGIIVLNAKLSIIMSFAGVQMGQGCVSEVRDGVSSGAIGNCASWSESRVSGCEELMKSLTILSKNFIT